MTGELRFQFGKNWDSFVRTALDERRVGAAVDGLRRMLKMDDLNGKSFIDVGCGSGLSSLSACLLGTSRLVAFDYDPDSVAATTALRDRAGIPSERWRITQGSILDSEFVATLEPADIVYSWGVLHHTGAMWQAVDNAIRLVKPGGYIAIAIYNNVEPWLGSSRQWWAIKRFYNQGTPAVRWLMEQVYVAQYIARHLLTLRNPFRKMRDYGRERGMDFRHDVRDWIGGFPYEYATAGEVFTYVHGTFGLQLVYLNSHDGHVCNEFTFRVPDRTGGSPGAGTPQRK